MSSNSRIIFNIPEYCDFFKFLLVEEIFFCSHPVKQHYGKCLIIGYLVQKSGKYFLQSLALPDKCYQLPDCFCEIKLIVDYIAKIPIYTTVEVFGELRLFESGSRIDDFSLHSSCDLIYHLRDTQLRLEQKRGLKPRKPSGMSDKSMNSTVKMLLQKELDEMKEKFKPYIKVYHISESLNAKDLIKQKLLMRKSLRFR